eukprot:PhF_6_TR13668/c0_g1_i1/m.21959
MLRRSINRHAETAWLTRGKTSLLPPRWMNENAPNLLIPKDNIHAASYAPVSDRTWQPQLQWVDTNPPRQARAQWEQRNIDYYDKEKPIIELAFDKPEAIPLLLKDLLIRGYEDAMDPIWFERAIHWVHEARYWRAIGIYWPLYHPARLRIHAWRSDLQIGNEMKWGMVTGATMFSGYMKDAIRDLEKALKRKEAGLEPRYKWSNWSPVGNPDGKMNDWLPRLPSMRWDPDPDGIVIKDEDLEFIFKAPENANPAELHDQIKKRYADFIFSDSRSYDGVFSFTGSSGKLVAADFPMFAENSLPFTDLRDMAYLVAYAKSLNTPVNAIPIDDALRSQIIQLRKDNDAKVEAVRLFMSCSSDIKWVRAYVEEKTGIEDFMKTPDRELTLILETLLGEMKKVVSGEEQWGKEIAASQTLSEYRAAVGDLAYNVAKQLQDASRNRVRQAWSSRFSAEGKEEKMLDFVLQRMSQRTTPQHSTGNMGEQFDREKEPVGRNTQRRVMAADKQGGKGKFWDKKKKKDTVDFDDNVLTKLT